MSDIKRKNDNTKCDVSIMVDSASRPQVLEKMLPSLIEHLKFENVKPYWMYHEAVLDKDLSQKCIDFVDGLNFFDYIEIEEEPKGQGYSISQVLKNVTGKYFIYWVDDHVAIRDIDVDSVFNFLECNKDVNQITFNKRKTMKDVSGWKKKEIERNGIKLTTSPHWRYMPAIWRLSWILPKWRCFEGPNHHWEMNKVLRENLKDLEKTPEWVIDNTGTYYYGGIGEKAFCETIKCGSQRSPEYNKK